MPPKTQRYIVLYGWDMLPVLSEMLSSLGAAQNAEEREQSISIQKRLRAFAEGVERIVEATEQRPLETHNRAGDERSFAGFLAPCQMRIGVHSLGVRSTVNLIEVGFTAGSKQTFHFGDDDVFAFATTHVTDNEPRRKSVEIKLPHASAAALKGAQRALERKGLIKQPALH